MKRISGTFLKTFPHLNKIVNSHNRNVYFRTQEESLIMNSITFRPLDKIAESRIFSKRFNEILSKKLDQDIRVAEKPFVLLEDTMKEIPNPNRTCLTMLRRPKESDKIEFLNFGDHTVLHLRKDLKKMKKHKKAKNEDKLFLMDIANIFCTYNLLCFPSFYGEKMSDSFLGYSYGKGELQKGDILVIANRGVTHSMTSEEVIEVVEGFLEVDREGEFFDPELVAEIIAETSFRKATEFLEDRPIVKILERGKVHPSNLIADECFCYIEQIKSSLNLNLNLDEE